MNEFFDSELWVRLKNGKMPDLVVPAQVYLYFGLTAVISGLIIIIAATYYAKR